MGCIMYSHDCNLALLKACRGRSSREMHLSPARLQCQRGRSAGCSPGGGGRWGTHPLQLVRSHQPVLQAPVPQEAKAHPHFPPVSSKDLLTVPGLRVLREIMLPVLTHVNHSPVTIFLKHANPTRHFSVSSVDLADSEGPRVMLSHSPFSEMALVPFPAPPLLLQPFGPVGGEHAPGWVKLACLNLFPSQ